MSEPQSPGGEDQIDVARQLEEGHQRFLGIDLLCGPGALVPRPETELLGQTAIDTLRTLQGPSKVIDMCCGVGNLACAVAVHVPDARVWASDLTDSTVEWARKNVAHLGLEDRVTVGQGDLFAGLAGFGLEGTIDVVICNPPYISTGRLMADRASLLENEPREAFDAGPYGLSIHQRVVREAPQFLKPGGWLMVEVGLGQDRQVRILFDRSRLYDAVAVVADDGGRPRVVLGQLRHDAKP